MDRGKEGRKVGRKLFKAAAVAAFHQDSRILIKREPPKRRHSHQGRPGRRSEGRSYGDEELYTNTDEWVLVRPDSPADPVVPTLFSSDGLKMFFYIW